MKLLKMMNFIFVFIITVMAWTQSEILQPLPFSPPVDKFRLRYISVPIPIESIQYIMDDLSPLLIRGVFRALVIQTVCTCDLVGCPCQ